MGRFQFLTLAELEEMYPPPPAPFPTPTDISEGLRWHVWERDNFTCCYCGSRRFLAADHIYPQSLGGPTILSNLQTLCTSCNTRKKDHFRAQDRAALWPRLVKQEPRLADLLAQAEAIQDDGMDLEFCGNLYWYGYYDHAGAWRAGLKEQLSGLVGWAATTRDPLLRCRGAYETAYDRIYKALPDCRNCRWCA